MTSELQNLELMHNKNINQIRHAHTTIYGVVMGTNELSQDLRARFQDLLDDIESVSTLLIEEQRDIRWKAKRKAKS